MDWEQRVSGILDERMPDKHRNKVAGILDEKMPVKHRNRVPGFLVGEGEPTEEPDIEESVSEVTNQGEGGGEFCTAYRDQSGNYHDGFQCPLSFSDGSETEEVYCCGTAFEKYCCDQPGGGLTNAHIGAIVGGLSGGLLLIAGIIILCCCFCSCCCVNRRRKSPRRRGHRPLPTPREPMPMTTPNGHANGKYPKHAPSIPPPLPSQPPPQMHPAPVAPSMSYPSPMQGYPQGHQPSYAPQMPPMDSMPPQQQHYNPHVQQQPMMMMNYGAQQYAPQHQYPPPQQQFGVPLPEPPPYSASAQAAEAPPLQDKGMAYPPSAMGGPSAPPP